MKSPFTVSLAKILKDFTLDKMYLPDDPENIQFSSVEVNRPGLQFSGYYEYYDNNRIQIVGFSETNFLKKFNTDEQKDILEKFYSTKPAAVIYSRDIEVDEINVQLAEKYGVPLLKTSWETSAFMSALIAFLNVQLAPRITRHGVLVEVYGEGILILGESGVGKSETAIELVKRGHRLIADDAVELRKVSSKSIVGSSPSNIRHFIELRGIGIVNARRIFGIGAVKPTTKIDMVINLEQWDSEKVYDRMGLEGETTNILDIDITSLTIPVKPGRNLAVIIEVAAMNNRQKKMGYNAASELLVKLGIAEPTEKDDVELDIFD